MQLVSYYYLLKLTNIKIFFFYIYWNIFKFKQPKIFFPSLSLQLSLGLATEALGSFHTPHSEPLLSRMSTSVLLISKASERACSIFLPRGTKWIQASVLELIQLFTSIWVHIDILCPYLPAQSHSCWEKIQKWLGQNDVLINCKSMHHFAPKWNLL